MKTKTNDQIKIASQLENGLFEVDGKTLTQDEFIKFRKLMPGFSFVTFLNHDCDLPTEPGAIKVNFSDAL
jgi:hypothetical protein